MTLTTLKEKLEQAIQAEKDGRALRAVAVLEELIRETEADDALIGELEHQLRIMQDIGCGWWGDLLARARKRRGGE